MPEARDRSQDVRPKTSPLVSVRLTDVVQHSLSNQTVARVSPNSPPACESKADLRVFCISKPQNDVHAQLVSFFRG